MQKAELSNRPHCFDVISPSHNNMAAGYHGCERHNYCPQCGKKCGTDVNFCSECGKKIMTTPTTDIENSIVNDIAQGERIVCLDPACTGIIGTDGNCGTCGKRFDSEEYEQELIERKKPNILRCPRCNSSQLTANKKGFGLGKAAIGGVLTGGVGLLAGFIGSGKVKLTCLKCGYSWKAGS